MRGTNIQAKHEQSRKKSNQMPVSDNNFETHAENALQAVFEQVDNALGDQLEVDLDGGILSIELASGGQYIINKQVPNRELWMSSPVSGAKHFYFDEETENWVDTRSDGIFFDILSDELTQISGQPFALK